MTRVNIILAAYNGERYLAEQIDSILKNEYKNWTLWIFDDGSTDNTSSIVEEYRVKYPNKIRYLLNKVNKGVVLNFLEGVKIVSESLEDSTQEEQDTYYMFCDQDDVWLPNKIGKTLNTMRKAELKYGSIIPIAVYTDAKVVDDNLRLIHPSFFRSSRLNTGKIDLPHIMMENKLIGCTVMFNSSIIGKMAQLPKQSRYHDWWVALIAAAFGKIIYIPDTTLLYRQHSHNVVGNQSFLAYITNRITSYKQQKDVLYKTIQQAREFYSMYHTEMSGDIKMQVYTLSKIQSHNLIVRKYIVLRFGYLKSGVIRNIGLLCLI